MIVVIIATQRGERSAITTAAGPSWAATGAGERPVRWVPVMMTAAWLTGRPVSRRGPRWSSSYGPAKRGQSHRRTWLGLLT
jgi:hypothetical protein